MLARQAMTLEKAVGKIEKIFCNVAVVAFFVLMILGTADVIGRYVFNRPITGAGEVSQFLVVIMVFLSWGYIQAKKGHITIGLIVSRLSSRSQAIAEFVNSFLFLALFSIIVWRALVIGLEWQQRGLYDQMTKLPTAPFQFLSSFGAFLVCLELIIQMVHLIPRMRRAS